LLPHASDHVRLDKKVCESNICNMVHESIEPNARDDSLDPTIAEIGAALAHPIRIAILRLLSDHERCSCEIEPLFELDQSGISRHLTALRRAGLIISRREGVKTMHCLSSPRVIELLHLVDRLAGQPTRQHIVRPHVAPEQADNKRGDSN